MTRLYISACLVAIICAIHSASALPTAFQLSTVPTQDEQNASMDQLLSKMTTVIKYLNMDEFSLHDIDMLVLQTSGAVLKDLSSWKRVDNATVSTTSDGKTNIKGSLAISSLETDFDNFQINFGLLLKIGGGKTQIAFSKNKFDIDITYGLDTNKKCKVELNEFVLSELGGYTMNFETSSVLNTITEYVAPYVMNYFTSHAVSLLGGQIEPIAKVTIGNLNLCL